MNRTEAIIRQAFADAEELAVEQDKESIVSLKGVVVVEGISFRISIRRNDSGNTTVQEKSSQTQYRYLYTGTISTLDPSTTKVMLSEKKRRAKEEKGLQFKDKDIYASSKFRCDSPDPQNIADKILSTIATLIHQDKSQLNQAIARAMTPEQLTLPFAAEQYSSDFLRREYSTASPENNAKRLFLLQRTLTTFPATPIAKLSKRQVNTIIKENNTTDEAIKLCFLFVEYLVQMRKCDAINPFSPPGARKTGGKNALAQQALDDAVYSRFFELLNKEISPITVIIALASSGFSFSDIKDLTINDLEIIPKYKDFVVVHIQREYAAISKHDFSRPTTPDAALLIRKALRELTTDEKSSDQRIWPKGLDNSTVNNEIRNLLVRAGFAGSFTAPGRPSEESVDIPAGILQTNYKRRLFSCGGLKNDPDTYNFLCGTMYNSSTYTNYESHTHEVSMLRLYQCLKPLSIEKKIEKPSVYRTEGENQVYEAYPKTNHEVAHVIGKVWIAPGQKLKICCEHGAHGIVRIDRTNTLQLTSVLPSDLS